MAFLTTPSQTNADPAEFRARAMAAGLDLPELHPDPIVQFERWYGQTIDAKLPEPNAMSLATVDADGQPSLRTVLLKLYDADGFVFFTNYHSRKARQMDVQRPGRAAVPLGRPGATGQDPRGARRASHRRIAEYFATRPRGSQIGAWSSPQSQVIGPARCWSKRSRRSSASSPTATYRCRTSGAATAWCRTASSSGKAATAGCMIASAIATLRAAGG
jgi:pyridoxine/pyridoxamine 5'-phosphate oxidase